MPIIDTSEFAKTGGLTVQELDIYKLANYDLVHDSDFKSEYCEICNAIHLIQAIFMSRPMIRLTEGKFWVKFDLPYEHNFPLKRPPHGSKYQKIIDDYLYFYTEFQKLEPYHPSHLDDVRRCINTLFEIISKHCKNFTTKV